MAASDIPSGRDARDSQADGSTAPGPGRSPAPAAGPSAPAANGAEHRFEVSAVWSGNGRGGGAVRFPGDAGELPVAGATVLGGSGRGANPEELLFAAIASCFLNTWAIFLEKLKVPYADPAVRVSGTVGEDPAGGFRMTGAEISARVPAALLEAEREKVEKTLSLAEKYCIISKAARSAMPLSVRIETV